MLVLLWVISNPHYPQSLSFQTTTANVAAWNLDGFQPIPTDKAETFADVITQIDPEVLVLVEINLEYHRFLSQCAPRGCTEDEGGPLEAGL
jgi:hypothetical protein